MGGRRSGSFRSLVGEGGKVTPAKANLKKAIASGDAGAIASAATGVVAASKVGLEALRFGLQFAPYVSRASPKLARLSPKDQIEAIRGAWSAFKRKQGFFVSAEVDRAVVSAATQTIREKAK